MRAVPYTILAVALAVALPVAFCRRPPAPDPAAEPVIGGAVGEAVPEVVALRVLAKGLLARDAAAGRRSLFEAAALFRALDRRPPEPAQPTGFDPTLRIPADTEEGRLCRQVLAAVRAELAAEPDRAAAAVARLKAEFAQELRARGAVRLPDPSSLESVEGLLRRARATLSEQQRRAILGSPEADR
jgi:hypothetical protein